MCVGGGRGGRDGTGGEGAACARLRPPTSSPLPGTCVPFQVGALLQVQRTPGQRDPEGDRVASHPGVGLPSAHVSGRLLSQAWWRVVRSVALHVAPWLGDCGCFLYGAGRPSRVPHVAYGAATSPPPPLVDQPDVSAAGMQPSPPRQRWRSVSDVTSLAPVCRPAACRSSGRRSSLQCPVLPRLARHRLSNVPPGHCLVHENNSSRFSAFSVS